MSFGFINENKNWSLRKCFRYLRWISRKKEKKKVIELGGEKINVVRLKGYDELNSCDKNRKSD